MSHRGIRGLAVIAWAVGVLVWATVGASMWAIGVAYARATAANGRGASLALVSAPPRAAALGRRFT